jgi:hypothetical protein
MQQNDIIIDKLHINRDEVLRYLHYNGQEIPPEINDMLAAAEAEILQTTEPRFVYDIFQLDKSDDSAIALQGTGLALPGQDMQKLLHDSASCLLMAATLGRAVDDLIRRTELKDMSKALMLDACASSAIENLCDQLQNALTHQLAEQRLFLTDRFSPGYGDLPITCQKPFCATLDCTRRIGLSVSASGLLLPRKSVTAIIGLADKPQAHRGRSCDTCNLAATCPFRKNNRTCGK